MILNSFTEVQTFIEEIMEQDKKEGAPPPKSPHKAFWSSLSYEEFTTGNVPGVLDPTTKLPVPILVKGNSASSNLILSLRGQGPLFDPNHGAFGRMPANGPRGFTEKQIQLLADWIDLGCPE
jgi:hypothetical protein